VLPVKNEVKTLPVQKIPKGEKRRAVKKDDSDNYELDFETISDVKSIKSKRSKSSKSSKSSKKKKNQRLSSSEEEEEIDNIPYAANVVRGILG